MIAGIEMLEHFEVESLLHHVKCGGEYGRRMAYYRYRTKVRRRFVCWLGLCAASVLAVLAFAFETFYNVDGEYFC